MRAGAPAVEAAHTLRIAGTACLVLAAAVVVVAAALHTAPVGGALAVGLVLGTLNGAAAARLITLPVPFLATSLARLVTLSLVGIAIGLLFGVSRIWLVILGLGAAQIVLAAAALRVQVRG